MRRTLICVVGWFVLLAALAALGTALGLRPEPGAQSSLEFAVPAPSIAGSHGGYSPFTAEELNRMGQGRELRRIHYVGPDVPSQGPGTVSVNVIDDFTWGGAAFSTQTERCYVVVAVTDRSNPQYGSTKYGWLPEGERCVGRSATLATAIDEEWPDANLESTATAGDVIRDALVLLLVPLGVLLILWRRSSNQRGVIGALVAALPLALLATIAWWFLVSATAGALETAWTEFGRWDYTAALAWAVIGSMPPLATMAGFNATQGPQTTLHRQVGLTAVAALLTGVPVTLIVAVDSII